MHGCMHSKTIYITTQPLSSDVLSIIVVSKSETTCANYIHAFTLIIGDTLLGEELVASAIQSSVIGYRSRRPKFVEKFATCARLG